MTVFAALRDQAARSRAIIEANDLATVGRPGPRWDGAEPATLERVLFHLLQEYAATSAILTSSRNSREGRLVSRTYP